MPLHILKASAGSGKTYSLTETYIRYCLAGDNSLDYTNILAITFTNKASAEMKDRIIALLHTLSTEPDEYPGIEGLCQELTLSHAEIKERAKTLLNRILSNFDQFTISTIDSFFTRLYGSMTLDLFNDAPRDITLDTGKALDYAADKLLKVARNDKELRTVLIDLLEEKIREGKGVGLHESLKKLGEELFNDTYLSLKEDSEYVGPARDVHKALNQSVDLIRLECQQYRQKIQALINRAGMTHEDFIYKFTENFLKREDPLELYKLSRFEYITDPEKWFKKADYDTMMSKVATVMDELAQTGKEYYSYVQATYRQFATYSVVLDNYAAYRILRFLDEAVQEYFRDQRLISLSDINLIIHRQLTTDDAMVVYEKIGQRLHSLMIDEFQDTSQIQWNNLKPLIHHNMSEGNPNLVVGDVKQAIYRFRNGNWEIMEIQLPEFQKQLGEQSDPDTLKTNWRSSPEIIHFNNEFFNALSSELTSVLTGFRREQFPDSEQNLQGSHAFLNMKALTEAPRNIYGNAGQEVASKNKDQIGYVELNYWTFNKETEKEEVLSERMEWLKSIISELYEEGYSGADIGILARRKKEMSILSEHLTRWSEEHSRYRYSSENSLRLDLSDGVQLLIAGLKIKSGIDVDINEMVFINYYSKLETNKDMNVNWQNYIGAEEAGGTILDSELFRTQGIDQLTSFFESLVDIAGLTREPGQWPYLLTFIEEVKKFELQTGPDVRLFLEEWDQRIKNVQIQMSDDPEKLRLITIHKSKGLEFEVVIIPFGDWDFEISRQTDTLWVQDFEDELLRLAGPLPISYKEDLYYSAFDHALMNEYLRNVVDNLNLLYVAMTRPRRRLYIRLQEKESKSKKPKEFEKPVRNTMDLFQMVFPDLADGRIVKGVKIPSIQHDDKERGPQEMPLLMYSIRHQPLSLHLRPSFEGSSDESVGKGLIIHRMLEDIEYHKDLHSAVSKSILSGDIREKDREEWTAKLREIITFEPVYDFFEEHWKVYNEKSIMVVDGSENRPDRVQENGKEYVIIDYKTGSKNPKYAVQVEKYKSLVADIVDLPVRGYIYYPLLPEIVEV